MMLRWIICGMLVGIAVLMVGYWASNFDSGLQLPATILNVPGILFADVLMPPDVRNRGWDLPRMVFGNALFYGLAGAGIAWMVSRRRRVSPGHCRKCRYDLTGNTSGVCPECGEGIKPGC